MTRRSFGFGVLALALMIAGCARTLPTYRYRITVEVETPQGLRSGSSVIEISGNQNTALAPGDAMGKINRNVRGEAVAVDLPDGKVLFALLDKADTLAEIALHAPNFTEDNAYNLMVAWMRTHPGPAILPPHKALGSKEQYVTPQPVDRPPENYPIMVTFGDLNDPKSVVKVDPNNLGKTFGRGVNLKGVKVEITDAPVTKAVEARLSWLGRAYEILKERNFHPDGIPVGNFTGLFSSEYN